MLILLHLLSAVSLLVWGTHIVRTGIMRVYGAGLRRMLSKNVSHKPLAFMAGIVVTALVQSSNATMLLVTSFVSQGLIALAPGLVIMLGADVGTALMVRILTFDLSWLSPLLIFSGVSLFLSRKQARIGQMGRVLIGLGLILLALELIVNAATPITQAAGVKVLFSSLTGDILLDALIGALFAIVSYSSLAAVLLTATLTATSVISLKVALCLVVGANLGSGMLAMINASKQSIDGRRVALGSLLFKLAGCVVVLPFIAMLAVEMEKLPVSAENLVIYFHVVYNLLRCLLMLPVTGRMAEWCQVLLRDNQEEDPRLRPRHLDLSVLDTPALALANAARETLRMGDIVENMLILTHEMMHGNYLQEKTIRRLDDDVDVLYTGIKLYLARMAKEDLGESDSRRWAEVIEVTMNLEQAGDILEKMAGDIRAKAQASRRAFSAEGQEELDALYSRLLDNLRLSQTVFFNNDIASAKRLRRSKHRFRIMDRRFAHAHVERLRQKNVQSLETSSLHLGLLGDMKRLNSLFCSVAYSVLELHDQDDDDRDVAEAN